MFERPGYGERAVLVHLSSQATDLDLEELQSLVVTANASPVAIITSSRRTPDVRYFIGQGKLEEINNAIKTANADIVIFNHPLSPSQERNLELALNKRVVDRNGLILDIFAQRAKTFEGKLQVELAQLRHLSTRLVRGWTHLERQKGGIGLRGPGETQLETDRRLLFIKLKQIIKRLGKVEKQRAQVRRKRKKASMRTVSIVGYTNAGKSTLFNAITHAETYVADQLFATLDPTVRNCCLPDKSEVVIADTVGFIRHLPHELVAAFKSTLQEASEADLLLHVIDANSVEKENNIAVVNQVLSDIDAGEVKQLLVFNKIDQLNNFAPRIDRNELGRPSRVWLSARDHQGIDLLMQATAELFAGDKVRKCCYLSPHQGKVRSSLYRFARIIEEQVDSSGGWTIDVEIEKKFLGLLKAVRVEEIN